MLHLGVRLGTHLAPTKQNEPRGLSVHAARRCLLSMLVYIAGLCPVRSQCNCSSPSTRWYSACQ